MQQTNNSQVSQSSMPPRWYERCGESFFTQLLPPFLDNPGTELKSLSQTCRFIYQIYSTSQSAIDLWKELLLNKYHHALKRQDLENLKGKLIMMSFYQLIYYEQHVEKLPEKLLTRVNEERNNSSTPCFLCASSYGGRPFAYGFISMLISSVVSEDYDPLSSIDVDFQYCLQMENSGNWISLYPISLVEEFSTQSHVDMSVGMIYSIVIRSDFNTMDFQTIFEGFHALFKHVAFKERLNRYIFTFAIYIKDVVDVKFSYKKLEVELRRFIDQNYYDISNYVIVECNLKNRDQVLKTAIETVKRHNSVSINRAIDTKLFLKHMAQAEKKKCLIM